jgi:endonuclease/exonuclease/phosphatase family metal-dependent hydrolase
MDSRIFLRAFCAMGLVLGVMAAVASAQTTQSLRIVAYNMESDIQNSTDPAAVTTPRSVANSGREFFQVLEGIGEEDVGGNVRPIDILGLEETTSNSLTVQPVVTALNNYYGAGTYAMSSYQATESHNDPTFGNGPNAMIYNTKTMQLMASVGVGSPLGGSSGAGQGEYRQVVRYTFRPVGGAASGSNDFYVYVSHMKSSSSDKTAADFYQDETYRNQEAAIIRANAATLPSGSSIVYMGDFNLSNSTGYTNPDDLNQYASAYQAMTGIDPRTGLNPSVGAAVDPTNPGNNYTITWDSNSTYKALLTDSSTKIRYRDDFQMMTQNVYNGSGSLAYVSNSLHPFGNDGNTGVGSNPGTSSTALKNLVLRGDLNMDGNITGADIVMMESALANLSAYESTHSIASHTFTSSDLLAVADINRDGTVNNADLQALLNELKNPTAANTPVSRSTIQGDLGIASDHLPLAADYVVTVGGGSVDAVPEPASLALLTIGSLMLLWRRGRLSGTV